MEMQLESHIIVTIGCSYKNADHLNLYVTFKWWNVHQRYFLITRCLCFLPGRRKWRLQFFAGRWRGQTRTLPIFNLASYHGWQSHPLDADLIKDNQQSRSSRRSVSDSSLLQRRLNKTLSRKWLRCFFSTNASVWLLRVATVTVKGRADD